jgi:hypothetical protein
MKIGRVMALAGALALAATGTALAWGFVGHGIISRIAAEGLPSDMPAFFTGAVDRLAYLGPEPDRWRDDDLTVMDEAWKYDHYIDLENVPAGALDAPDRFEFLEALYRAGVEEPEQTVGFLPFRMLELYQRLATGFARWRTAESPEERAWIEDRIVNDAGILGHYVADAANPHHTTIHFNGWAEDAPNPEGYTTSRDFHWRFESQFVEAHIDVAPVRDRVAEGADAFPDARAAIWRYLMTTHEQVVAMYELEKTHGFDPERATPETEAFVLDRMAAAATMLRGLWYTAWVESAGLATRD